jgi:hypothetical protein
MSSIIKDVDKQERLDKIEELSTDRKRYLLGAIANIVAMISQDQIEYRLLFGVLLGICLGCYGYKSFWCGMKQGSESMLDSVKEIFENYNYKKG